MSPPRLMICPFCGHTQRPSERCQDCGTAFEPGARRATVDRMGPWFVRDTERPFQPGCSYEAIRSFVEQGRVGRYTIVRGPTTRQLWTVARHVPGLAHLLGYCHACDAPVDPRDGGCHHCGASFTTREDRNSLGLVDDEDEPRGGAPGRSVGYVPAPSTRLSAFASDEELLDPRGRARPALRSERHGEDSADGAGMTAVLAAPARGGGATGDGLDAGAALRASIERSLRATLRRQRLVSAFLLGLVIALFAASAWLFVRGGAGRGDGAQSADLATPSEGAASTEAAPAPQPARSGSTSNGPGAAEKPASSDFPPNDLLDALSREIAALESDRSADADARRAALASIASRLSALSGADGARADSLRGRIEELRARIELDAALPPQQQPTTPQARRARRRPRTSPPRGSGPR